MIKVKLTTNFPEWSLYRQTPESLGGWENCQFYINENTEECDWWVIFDGLKQEQTTRCYPRNTLLITGEPSHIKKYSKKFTKQFDTIVTSQKKTQAKNVISLQLLPWHIGAHRNIITKGIGKFEKTYDELKKLGQIKKTRLISIISSNKSTTCGHKQRLKFLQVLKDHFGNDLDIFGSDINTIPDKWDGIASYKYHIVIENGVEENYWTEKLADSFLAEAYPIYFGCPNINDYFPKNSLVQININKPAEAILLIEKAIREDYYNKFFNELIKSKDLVLDHYQIFPQLCRIINELQKNIANNTEKILITIEPEVRTNKNILLRIFDRMLK